MNNFKIFLMCSFISGCGMLPTRVEYVKVSYPILVCPAPPELVSPNLYINQLLSTDSKDYKKVAKFYDITLKQLTTYIDQLELVIDRYNKTSESYKELQEKVDAITITSENE